MFGLIRRLRRHPLPPEPSLWLAMRARTPWVARLDPERDTRLQLLAARFLADKTITPINDLSLDATQRLQLAALCCLPLLEFGAGGLQFIRRDFTAKLQHAADAGVPVVVCSQCLYERSDFSVYEVGQKALGSGVIQGSDMTSEAAVTKLMWALGNCAGRDEVRALFGRNLAGEIEISQ